MDQKRQFWNQQQQMLRQLLGKPSEHAQAIELFLRQHAMVHSPQISQAQGWSFEAEIWQDISEATVRQIPAKGEHSIIWMFWHIARIEDVTMNLLLAGSPQLFLQDNWSERLKITLRHTGNEMDAAEVLQLSNAIDIEALRAYRLAVGRRTRAIVQQLSPAELKHKVAPAGLQQIRDDGAVGPAAEELIEYWSALTKAGLLLMPPTRHNFVHLNEASRIKHQLRARA